MTDIITTTDPTVLVETQVETRVIETGVTDTVVMGDSAVSVVITETTRQIIETPAAQGPAGPQGIPGPAGTAVLTRTAGHDLGGHRVVITDDNDQAAYAEPSTLDHRYRIRGITTGAALTGDPVTIQTYGELTEPSWAFTPGAPVYFAAAGVLTHTPPAAGFIRIIGVALAATRLFIDLEPPIELN